MSDSEVILRNCCGETKVLNMQDRDSFKHFSLKIFKAMKVKTIVIIIKSNTNRPNAVQHKLKLIKNFYNETILTCCRYRCN